MTVSIVSPSAAAVKPRRHPRFRREDIPAPEIDPVLKAFGRHIARSFHRGRGVHIPAMKNTAFGQLAFADGEVLVTGEMNELEKASFLSTLNKMAEKKKNTGKEMFVGVTRVLSDNESKVFFEKVKGQYPEMDIKIPFLTVMETLQYKPAESAAKVQCPVLVVIAGQDSVNPPEQGRALYDAVASGTKELYEEADACHYDIYEGAFFERVAAVQTQWFKKHL